ncbi:carbon-nitrogen hydrolase family protein [Dasania marina]|uniref:carbon-nitrogen hydrolase family protein n=1 Tax=Dasania marina TaxID=471499 RepID=UPI0030D94C83|tara:strand:- start:43265 stop:44101 length:837 start_codon:yes stop_codon:yes gene_type:complete
MTVATIAAIQMLSGSKLDENLARAEMLMAQAVAQGAQLVVLPEVFAMFASAQQYAVGVAEATGKAPIRQFLAQQARKHKVWIVAGSIPIADAGSSSKVYAASLLFNDRGEECARYNKLHLFDVDVADKQGSYKESNTFVPGNDVVVFATPFGRLGMAICYDLRFPEFFRAMFAEGVDVISVPAAFTRKTGEAHWLPLLRARAIENQCYIIGANQGGDHDNGRETSGGSAIIDGWGQILAQADKGEACVVANMDLASLQQLRLAMPIQQHQRFTVQAKN